MGNTFGFLHTEAEGGFQFTVAEVCKAADINLNETCNLVFNAGHELMSIGNVIRGTMEAKPGIAGIGVSTRRRNITFSIDASRSGTP